MRMQIRGKADRIDLLDDGTLRVVDYKLGRAPKPARALQLPVYGVCASQQLEERRGRAWPLSRAGYVAFKEKNAFVSLGGNSGQIGPAVADGQHRMVAAVAASSGVSFPWIPTSRSLYALRLRQRLPEGLRWRRVAARPADRPLSRRCSADVPARRSGDVPAARRQRSETRSRTARRADREAARRFAVDPLNNVVLEASAGTGKTSVLVSRYLNLLSAGVEPANILAITFTRKAAAEMRERIVARAARRGGAIGARSRRAGSELRDRLGEIAISTIDAFCLSLLREFPLEADVDPGFEMADETEVPRLVEESLDQSLRIFTGLARSEPDVALVLAQLGLSRTREGLAALLDRRLVAWGALDRFLAARPGRPDRRGGLPADVDGAAGHVAVGRRAGWRTSSTDGPVGHPRYQLLLREIRRLPDARAAGRRGGPRR